MLAIYTAKIVSILHYGMFPSNELGPEDSNKKPLPQIYSSFALCHRESFKGPLTNQIEQPKIFKV